MPYREIEQAERRAVGTKQTLKAVQKSEAEKIFIARDADERVVKPVVELCQNSGVEIVYVESMKDLGKACGIAVGAAAAAILKS